MGLRQGRVVLVQHLMLLKLSVLLLLLLLMMLLLLLLVVLMLLVVVVVEGRGGCLLVLQHADAVVGRGRSRVHGRGRSGGRGRLGLGLGGRTLGFPLSRLNAVLLHGQRSGHLAEWSRAEQNTVRVVVVETFLT